VTSRGSSRKEKRHSSVDKDAETATSRTRGQFSRSKGVVYTKIGWKISIGHTVTSNVAGGHFDRFEVAAKRGVRLQSALCHLCSLSSLRG